MTPFERSKVKDQFLKLLRVDANNQRTMRGSLSSDEEGNSIAILSQCLSVTDVKTSPMQKTLAKFSRP
jgi:riboflavin synthase alpha subunit